MHQIRTLLIVAHIADDLALLRGMLKDCNAYQTRVTYAATAREAELLLEAEVPDIVLLHLALPDAPGLDAVRRVRAIAPAVPLLVLNGFDDDVLAAQSLQEGAQDCLILDQLTSRGLVRALSYATERKRLERQKDEFVSTVSHELRTPLTSISGSLGLLVGQPTSPLPAAATRLLAIAYRNSQRLVRLVNDILDIDGLQSGQVTFHPQRVNVRTLVREAVEASRGFAGGHAVRVRFDGSTIVPDVLADVDRLLQAVTNLLSNAVKFSPAESEVRVSIEARGDFVRILVRDHGAGIPANFRSRVFERFAQADTSDARRKGGTGLGLNIVRQIVHRLGGRADFRDAKGGGTVFFIELPAWTSNTSPQRNAEVIAPGFIPSVHSLLSTPPAAASRTRTRPRLVP